MTWAYVVFNEGARACPNLTEVCATARCSAGSWEIRRYVVTACFARGIEHGASHVSGLPASLTAAAAKELVIVCSCLSCVFVLYSRVWLCLLPGLGGDTASFQKFNLEKLTKRARHAR